MKEYDYNITPTIVNKKICIFDFEILECRTIFKFLGKKLVYSGSCIINRKSEVRVLGEKFMQDGTSINGKVRNLYEQIESSCKWEAEFIFAGYDIDKT